MRNDTEALDRVLAEIPRYDPEISGGCGCCGTYIEFELFPEYGDYVKYDELKKLISNLKSQQ